MRSETDWAAGLDTRHFPSIRPLSPGPAVPGGRGGGPEACAPRPPLPGGGPPCRQHPGAYAHHPGVRTRGALLAAPQTGGRSRVTEFRDKPQAAPSVRLSSLVLSSCLGGTCGQTDTRPRPHPASSSGNSVSAGGEQGHRTRHSGSAATRASAPAPRSRAPEVPPRRWWRPRRTPRALSPPRRDQSWARTEGEERHLVSEEPRPRPGVGENCICHSASAGSFLSRGGPGRTRLPDTGHRGEGRVQGITGRTSFRNLRLSV